jgi:hypothetical protein
MRIPTATIRTRSMRALVYAFPMRTRGHLPVVGHEISRFPRTERPYMAGSRTARARRSPAHDSGSVWMATPSLQWTFTTYSLQLYRRTETALAMILCLCPHPVG